MHPVINKIEPINEIDKLLYKTWSKEYKPAWVEVGELKTCLPVMYEDVAEEIENFEVRPDDVFITSHPRSGTTWTQEMVWLVANNCDFERAKEKIHYRCPYLDSQAIMTEKVEILKNNTMHELFPFLNNYKRQRFIKSHLPFNLLPRQIRDGDVNAKIVHVMRNPKDACVSFYHLSKTLYEYFGTLEEFCEQFMAGRTYYGPYWSHVFSYWNQRHRSNLLVIKYEDMKRNMPGVLTSVANFFNKELTEEQIDALIDHLSFEKLSRNESVNCEEGISRIRQSRTDDKNAAKFMRKGKIGGYKDEMSSEMIKRFDEWIEENTRGTDFHHIQV